MTCSIDVNILCMRKVFFESRHIAIQEKDQLRSCDDTEYHCLSHVRYSNIRTIDKIEKILKIHVRIKRSNVCYEPTYLLVMYGIKSKSWITTRTT